MKQLPGNIPVVLTGIPHSDNVVYSTILFMNYELNIILQLFRFQNISAEVQIGIFSHNKVTKILAMKDPTPAENFWINCTYQYILLSLDSVLRALPLFFKSC